MGLRRLGAKSLVRLRSRRSLARHPILEGTTMTDQSKPYTPLTTDNSALVLVDHQVGLMTGVRDYETGELKHNVVAWPRLPRCYGSQPLSPPRPATACGGRPSPNSWKWWEESASSIAPRSTRGTIRKSRPPSRRPDARS